MNALETLPAPEDTATDDNEIKEEYGGALIDFGHVN